MGAGDILLGGGGVTHSQLLHATETGIISGRVGLLSLSATWSLCGFHQNQVQEPPLGCLKCILYFFFFAFRKLL